MLLPCIAYQYHGGRLRSGTSLTAEWRFGSWGDVVVVDFLRVVYLQCCPNTCQNTNHPRIRLSHLWVTNMGNDTDIGLGKTLGK